MGPSFIVSNCIELYDVVPYQCNPHKTIYFVTSKSKKSLIYDSLILFLPVDFILSFHKDRCRMVWTWIRSVKFAKLPLTEIEFLQFHKTSLQFHKIWLMHPFCKTRTTEGLCENIIIRFREISYSLKPQNIHSNIKMGSQKSIHPYPELSIHKIIPKII